MTLQQVLLNVLNSILVIVVPVLAGYLIQLVRFKTANTKVNQYLGILQDAVASAVDWVAQTIVWRAKENKAWDKPAMEEAFAAAKSMTMQILGETGLRILSQAAIDVEALIAAKIEQRVKWTPSAPVPAAQ
jgi:hypothetical protein